MTHPNTPEALIDKGYRIEYGEATDFPDAPSLHGKYWWTWARCSGIVSSQGQWDSAQEAIDDAWRDLEVNSAW